MHLGATASRNDFAHESAELVYGCIGSSDDYILDRLAERGLEAEPERSDVPCENCDGDGCHECDGTGLKRAHGQDFVGPDAEAADALLTSIQQNELVQAAGRYARSPDDSDDSAIVFVASDALSPGYVDATVPGVVWTYGRSKRVSSANFGNRVKE